MTEADLIGIKGRELMAIRERAGWSRPRLAYMMERDPLKYEFDPCTEASIKRYEALDLVPPVFARRVRECIGHEIFDRLFELVRNGDDMSGHGRRTVPGPAVPDARTNETKPAPRSPRRSGGAGSSRTPAPSRRAVPLNNHPTSQDRQPHAGLHGRRRQ